MSIKGHRERPLEKDHRFRTRVRLETWRLHCVPALSSPIFVLCCPQDPGLIDSRLCGHLVTLRHTGNFWVIGQE